MWACEACCDVAGEAWEGRGGASAGYCGAGRHTVRVPIEWHPEITPRPAVTVDAPAPAQIPNSAKQKSLPVQGDLFG